MTIRKWIEGCFGWCKIIGGIRNSCFIDREKLDFQLGLTFAVFQFNADVYLGMAIC